MTDINIRSDNVDVEQIMRQIRARIRELESKLREVTHERDILKKALAIFMPPTS